MVAVPGVAPPVTKPPTTLAVPGAVLNHAPPIGLPVSVIEPGVQIVEGPAGVIVGNRAALPYTFTKKLEADANTEDAHAADASAFCEACITTGTTCELQLKAGLHAVQPTPPNNMA